MLEALALCLLILLPLMPARRLAEAFFPRADPLRQVFAALWCYLLIAHFLMLVLGTLGLLRLPWMLGAQALVAAASLALPRPPQPFNLASMIGGAFVCATAHERIAGVLLTLPVVYAFLRFATEGPFFMWDDWAYHGPAVTGMMRSDSTSFQRHNFAMYYPFNPHLLNVFLTLPTGDLRWVWLAPTYWVAIASVAWVTLSLEAPRRAREFFLLSGAVFGLSMEVRWTQIPLGHTDLASAVSLFSAYVLARPPRGANNREVALSALFCGLVIGYTVGTKHFYTFPAIGAALACVYFSTWGREGAAPGWRPHLPMVGKVFGLGLLGTTLSGSYWYLYNLVLTGNPMFPVRFFDLPGTLKASKFEKTTMKHMGNEAGWSWEFLADAWRQWLNWPEPHGWFLTLGLLAGAGTCARLVWHQVGRWRPGAATTWNLPLGVLPAMILSAAILIGAYPFLPYSGTYIGTEDLIISRRFMVFCLVVGLATWAYLAGAEGRVGAVYARVLRVVFYALLLLQWPLLEMYGSRYPGVTVNLLAWLDALMLQLVAEYPTIWWDRFGWALAALAVVALAAVRLAPDWVARAGEVLRPRIPLPAVLGVGVLALAVVRPMWLEGPYNTRLPRWDATFLIPSVHGAVELLPADSRVGMFNNNSWETWAVHGSRGQLEPVFLHSNGQALPSLHEAHQRGLIDPADDDTPHRLGLPWYGEVPKPERFAERLRAANLDYLFLTMYPTDEMPPHRELVAQMADFRLIHSTGYNEIYQVMESPDEPVTLLPNAPTKNATAGSGS